MDAAMYKALSGAIAQMHRLEVSAQDLANVNTSGYKGQRLGSQSQQLVGEPVGSGRSCAAAAVRIVHRHLDTWTAPRFQTRPPL